MVVIDRRSAANDGVLRRGVLAVRGMVGAAVLCLGSPFALAGEEKSLEQIQADYQEYLYASYEGGRMPEADRLMDFVMAAYEQVDAAEDAEQAVAALHLVMEMSSKAEGGMVADWQDAADRLSNEYVDEPSLALVIDSLGYVPPALEGPRDEFLEMVAAETTNDEVRAAVCMGTAKRILREDLMGGCDEKDAAQLPGLLDKLAADFGEVEDPYGRGNFATMASRMKYEWENLRVGSQVPDLAGVDGDGVPFKLSDYAGKVIFLDFWAHW